MARGIYSALGHWPELQLPRMVEKLRTLGAALDSGETEDSVASSWPARLRPRIVELVKAVRTFEARVGQACSLDAEIVTTPTGRAVELGNRGHVAFGVQHEEAAAVVARCLVAVLEGLGATGAFCFTMD